MYTYAYFFQLTVFKTRSQVENIYVKPGAGFSVSCYFFSLSCYFVCLDFGEEPSNTTLVGAS